MSGSTTFRGNFTSASEMKLYNCTIEDGYYLYSLSGEIQNEAHLNGTWKVKNNVKSTNGVILNNGLIKSTMYNAQAQDVLSPGTIENGYDAESDKGNGDSWWNAMEEARKMLNLVDKNLTFAVWDRSGLASDEASNYWCDCASLKESVLTTGVWGNVWHNAEGENVSQTYDVYSPQVKYWEGGEWTTQTWIKEYVPVGAPAPGEHYVYVGQETKTNWVETAAAGMRWERTDREDVWSPHLLDGVGKTISGYYDVLNIDSSYTKSGTDEANADIWIQVDGNTTLKKIQFDPSFTNSNSARVFLYLSKGATLTIDTDFDDDIFSVEDFLDVEDMRDRLKDDTLEDLTTRLTIIGENSGNKVTIKDNTNVLARVYSLAPNGVQFGDNCNLYGRVCSYGIESNTIGDNCVFTLVPEMTRTGDDFPFWPIISSDLDFVSSSTITGTYSKIFRFNHSKIDEVFDPNFQIVRRFGGESV